MIVDPETLKNKNKGTETLIKEGRSIEVKMSLRKMREGYKNLRGEKGVNEERNGRKVTKREKGKMLLRKVKETLKGKKRGIKKIIKKKYDGKKLTVAKISLSNCECNYVWPFLVYGRETAGSNWFKGALESREIR